MKFIFLLLLTLLFSASIFAQNLPQTDTQWWNEITVSKPLIKTKDSKGKDIERVSVFFNGTLRFGNKIKTVIDERAGFGFDFKVNKYLTLTPSYVYRYAKPTLNSKDYESRFRFAATLEKKWSHFSLKDRNLVEYRMRNSKADSTRYRNKITFTVPILKDKKELFSPFVSTEPYYEFRAKAWTRNELWLGISKKFTRNFTMDFFYIREDNKSGLPKSVNGLGTYIKIKLD